MFGSALGISCSHLKTQGMRWGLAISVGTGKADQKDQRMGEGGERVVETAIDRVRPVPILRKNSLAFRKELVLGAVK